MLTAKSKTLAAAGVLAFILGTVPLYSAAQEVDNSTGKYGFVNISKVIAQSDEGQAQAQELKSMATEMEDKLNARRAELDKLVSQYDASVSSGAPDTRLGSRIEDLKRELARDIHQAQSDIDTSRKDRIRAIGAKVVKLLKRIGKERGFTAIFRTDGGQVAYVDPEADITDEAIAAYNDAYPVE